MGATCIGSKLIRGPLPGVQAIGAITLLVTAIGVPWWQQSKARAAERQAKAEELASLRWALYTEVRILAYACLQQTEHRR
jgi:hypothetical protein